DDEGQQGRGVLLVQQAQQLLLAAAGRRAGAVRSGTGRGGATARAAGGAGRRAALPAVPAAGQGGRGRVAGGPPLLVRRLAVRRRTHARTSLWSAPIGGPPLSRSSGLTGVPGGTDTGGAPVQRRRRSSRPGRYAVPPGA